ncbi:immunoglobulin-binding protein, putative [Eimeria acervulina]|uniref:Immunoglobulin-binding protein, putative n=1 Tax=Eimeria acervulina TaxID=5801 RepID=U6G755_EIMAC|nr:immunoglobulin-binding protein, putative [Eimeria acervulina]CDI76061.1 immunoglobulin-binding protein, putative [Eimeria acervulina]
MPAAERNNPGGGCIEAFSSLFDLCLKAFLQRHSALLSEDCSSSSSSSRFELPQDLLLQLQEETGISIDSAAAADAASSSSSSSNNSNNNNSSSSKELRESWSSDLYRCLLLLHKVYRHLRLISPNESADDISTSVIRYLLLPYCLGLMLLERPGPLQDRPVLLREAQLYLLEYLHSVECAELLSQEEAKRLEETLDSVSDPAAATPHTFPRITDPAARRHAAAVAAAGAAAVAAVDNAHGAAADAANASAAASAAAACAAVAHADAAEDVAAAAAVEVAATAASPWARDAAADDAHSERPGCHISELPAEAKSTASGSTAPLGCNFYLPTMSLAECADIEMEMETKQIGAAKPKVVVEFSTGEARQAAKEAEEMEARAWDDWKDENPKGSGNKMWNRG